MSVSPRWAWPTCHGSIQTIAVDLVLWERAIGVVVYHWLSAVIRRVNLVPCQSLYTPPHNPPDPTDFVQYLLRFLQEEPSKTIVRLLLEATAPQETLSPPCYYCWISLLDSQAVFGKSLCAVERLAGFSELFQRKYLQHDVLATLLVFTSFTEHTHRAPLKRQ